MKVAKKDIPVVEKALLQRAVTGKISKTQLTVGLARLAREQHGHETMTYTLQGKAVTKALAAGEIDTKLAFMLWHEIDKAKAGGVCRMCKYGVCLQGKILAEARASA